MEHTLKFRTNIKCAGCIEQVKPVLDAEKEIISWSVATEEADKVLTVQTEDLTAVEIINLVKSAGYKAESL